MVKDTGKRWMREKNWACVVTNHQTSLEFAQSALQIFPHIEGLHYPQEKPENENLNLDGS